jgi:hypothetical protein
MTQSGHRKPTRQIGYFVIIRLAEGGASPAAARAMANFACWAYRKGLGAADVALQS